MTANHPAGAGQGGRDAERRSVRAGSGADADHDPLLPDERLPGRLVTELPDAVSLHDAEGTCLVTVALRGPALVFADRERLTVAVKALFHNAVKHTPVGTDVWIRVEDHPDGRLLVVEDNGPGVPDLLKTAVFDRLAHGAPDQDHPDPGLGLGLYLVDQIARAHDGRAWVEDRTGGGASFRILLPSARPPTRS